MNTIRELKQNDLILGPSNDGGYWLIGLSEKIISKHLHLPFINIRWSKENVLQKTIDNLDRPDVDEDPTGNATIETYTVANGRDGPQMGIVIGRVNANNKRFIAISNDEKTLEIMMTEECLNRDCIISRNSEGLNIFSI